FAIETEYHPTHAHFHIRDFYVARLWRSTAAGGRRGTKPVAFGDKNGFCPEDTARIDGAEDARGRYSCFSEHERAAGPRQVVGISAGWKDVYPAKLPDQFVEISNVGDGYYALEIELDPNGVFEESDELNNVTCVVVKLEGTTAELLPPEVTC
ncbi:MAG: lysyl oxidase family protein, partial [Actinomycetota bacterium]|nr:lysyl oxidase family protein [Actinomycetota bacterium]